MSRTLDRDGRLRIAKHWVFSRLQIENGRSREIEKDIELDEQGLETMKHWRDPLEKQRIFRCRRHSLLDDNPTSG